MISTKENPMPTITREATIRLLVADNRPAVRSGLCRLLGEQPDFNVVAVSDSADGALAVAQRVPVDVAVINYDLGQAGPGSRNGLWVGRKLKRLPEPPRVLVYAANVDGHLALNSVLAEIDGLVSTGLCSAIRSVTLGKRLLPSVPQPVADMLRRRFDDQQQAAFAMLLAGISGAEVAQVLRMSQEDFDSRLWGMRRRLEGLLGDTEDHRHAA
jgi:DNA-binding NarL/FixJ family response regulator